MDDRKKINLIYWINPERSELFFAKKIILVEGQTDKTIIPFLAKKLNVFKNEYTIIDCGSKDNMPLYIKLLNGFKLNYIVVYDRDHQANKDANGINSANISTAGIENVLDARYGTSIVLINDIEEEIGIIERNNKNKPFIALSLVSELNYEIPNQIQNKINTIYG
ncbi:ATP-dependent endonuclease [Flavobacterium sp. H122]|uniref:ATP-dependent nuclease n=1 Tax=Flavobacterium sp. H122 TaxID=2529860 RepID=UPI00352C5250